MVAGFKYAPFGELRPVEQMIDDETCAIMIEPIQGEGGVRLPPPMFLSALRKLCDDHELLLIFDEVQSGCGRTGEWFGYQYFGVEPDVMTLAKSLCGGIAGGALLAKPEVAASLRPGMHAATFGGNPIASRAGIAAIEMIEQEGLLENAKQLGEVFRERLTALHEQCALIKEVRVAGVMIGLELNVEGAPFVKACLDRRLLINCTQNTVLRLLPAMNLAVEQANEGIDILASVLTETAR